MIETNRSEDSRYDLGLLFTDGMVDLDDTSGYRGAIAARAAGISYRQLDYWARTELVEPTVRGAAGSGSQRLYGFRDILVLKLVKRLLDTGISLQQIRIAVGKVLREVESSLVELDSVAGEDPADELAQRRASRAS